LHAEHSPVIVAVCSSHALLQNWVHFY